MNLKRRRGETLIKGKNVAPKLVKGLLLLTFLSTTLFVIYYSSRKLSLSSAKSDECWLRDAFHGREFFLFSHRTFVNANEEKQPMCQEALSQLKSIGVNHFDLDLVLTHDGEYGDKLILSHPMEFKRTSTYYSPCYSLTLNEFIDLLDSTFGDRDYFISLEPKAWWGRTKDQKDDPALANPADMLTTLLDVITKHNLNKKQCAVIVNTSTVQGTLEHQLLTNLVQEYCQLFVGMRKTDAVSHEILDTHRVKDNESSNDYSYKYDSIMPTIEFHPKHKNGVAEQKHTISDKSNKHSIYWVVDNIDDLRLAANLRPLGIVSNNPRKIVSILNDPSQWCTNNEH